MTTYIKNANWIHAKGTHPQTSIYIKEGKIAYIGAPPPQEPACDRVIDAAGLFVSAGLIELHVHGGGGADFADATPEAFRTAMLAHAKHGVTALMPTLVACDEQQMSDVVDAYRQTRQSAQALPELLGIHVEGPYVSPQMAGALDPSLMRVPLDGAYHGWLSRWPELMRMTLAPELPGAQELVKALKQSGKMASIGHSCAQYKDIMPVMELGADTVTHLYSCCSTITRESGYRKLGIIETALLTDLYVEIIADGKHIPPELLKLVLKTKAAEQILLVTDAMRAAGQDVSQSILGSLHGGQPVIVEDGVAKLPDRQAFAGSVATADLLLRTMHKIAGASPEATVAMMSENPARLLGRTDIGSLRPGAFADLVLWDEDWNAQQVFLRGTPIL